MAYAVLVGLTLLSCLLFEFSKLGDTLKKLTSSYKEQFRVMADKSIVDEVKQKLLMQQISKQLFLLSKLILGILLFIAPFFSLYFLKYWDDDLNPDILISLWGLIIPLVTVLLYILLKKTYVKIFGNG